MFVHLVINAQGLCIMFGHFTLNRICDNEIDRLIDCLYYQSQFGSRSWRNTISELWQDSSFTIPLIFQVIKSSKRSM